METNTGQPLLNDLALIYLAMAHSTDEDLCDDEINAMADRLQAWQQVDSKTIAGALKTAVDVYLMADGPAHVRQAVLNVRDGLAPENRKLLLDDLMNIAMSDDRFLHRESSFIADLMRAWEINASDGLEQGDGSWSILNPDGGQPNGWSVLHDLALIYLTLAQRTDGNLCEEEVSAIAEKLHEWLPNAAREDVMNVVRDALAAYVQGPDERVFTESVQAVSRLVPTHQRSALLDDLRHVAEADGKMIDAERLLIGRLEQAWANQA